MSAARERADPMAAPARGGGAGRKTPGETPGETLFGALERINERPPAWSRTTTHALWTSPDISEMLLRYHLDGQVDVASRRSAFIEASLDWIVRRFDVGPATRVIDLGCGPGLYTIPLARRGARVTGVDIAPRSIEHARAQASSEGLDVEHVLGDYLTYEAAAPFDLALLIMCDFCAFPPEQRARLLAQVRRMLRPGGAFLFDVYSMAAFETWDEQVAYGPGLMDGFWSSRPYHGFLSTYRYERERVVLEKYVIVEADRTSEYLNWFAHFDPPSLRAEVERAGLVVEEVLGDVAGAAYEPSLAEFALIARSPGGTP